MTILIGLAGLWMAIAATAWAGQNDSLQEHVLISGVAYDDGFGVALKDPAAIWYQKSTGEVYVADAGNSRVIIYDSLLTAIYSFKHHIKDPLSGTQVPGQPRGLAVTSDGEILLLDGSSSRLDLLDFRGRLLTSVVPNRLLNDTTLHLVIAAITVDDHDNFYVVISGDLLRVLVLDKDLNLIRQFGEKGNLTAQLTTPVSIGVSKGRVYVGDLNGLPAVKVFDSLGQFQFGFGGHDVQPEDLSFPVGIAFLDGPLTGVVTLVVDGLRQAVKVYDSEGKLTTMIGGFGYLPGLLQYPTGLSSDGVAMFYVVEKGGARVQRYQLK
jgi:hypothetical protein